MKYTEWQLLNEALGTGFPLGLSNPNTIGGVVGSNLQEQPVKFKDEKDEEDEEDLEDEEVPEDLLGGDEEKGPEKSFPPDNSEEMDGLPTPDEEMLDGDDEMADTLAGIDPDLAGLGGDDEVPPELGDEVPPELGDELGPELGDELGPEMEGPPEPCPDCNPDAEMEEGEGDPDCKTCGGEGFLPPEEGEALPAEIDAELEGGLEGDLGGLIALSRDFFQEYAAHHDDFFQIGQLSDGHIADYFSRWIDDENGETFVAVAENRVVGYITLYVRERAAHWRIGKVGDISGLMVHKDYRRRGIATQLLAHARAFFAKRAVRYFTVYTAVENKAAIAFYERNGLVPLHTNMIGVSDTALDDLQT